MIEKYTKLKGATGAIIARRQEITSRLEAEERELEERRDARPRVEEDAGPRELDREEEDAARDRDDAGGVEPRVGNTEREPAEDERHRRDVDGAERDLDGPRPPQRARRPGEEELLRRSRRHASPVPQWFRGRSYSGEKTSR